jgi:transposase-like protein
MSRPGSVPMSEVEVLAMQRRRRYSAEEKQRMVQETYQPGMTLSHVALIIR